MEVASTNWRILYRGALDSCNYSCSYCPFALKKNTREELAYDKAGLFRFVDWVEQRVEHTHILFTPWGEGLIRSYYQQAMLKLSHAPNVKKVAIQTNLSCALDWVKDVNKKVFALWVTYHPLEVDFEKFVAKCEFLIEEGIQFSIGVVGVKEHFSAITKLKERIKNRYIWINAYKREKDYYSDAEERWLSSVDALFPINNKVYATEGKACDAGDISFTVDEKGDVQSCHFIKKQLGNIYTDDIVDMLHPRTCVNTECRCYLGYINLKELNLNTVYGNSLLERIPQDIIKKP